MKTTFLILFLCLISNLFAQLSAEQEKTIAELQKDIKEAQHDSIILKAWRAWDDIIYPYDPNLDYELNFKIDSLSGLNLAKHLPRKQRIFFLHQKAATLNILVGLNSFKGKALLAQKYAFKALKVREELGDPAGVAGAMSNIAIFYNTQQEYPKAIKYLDSANRNF